MRVVSNTSPILNLSIIGYHLLLQEQVGEIWVPSAVLQELRRDFSRPGDAMSSLTFDELLEALEQFPVEQQESLVEILQHRLADKRRAEIIRNAKIARKQFGEGDLPAGTIEDLMADLLREDA